MLQNPKNLGPYVSRNQAIQVATGEFVACLDSDAWPHPRWLQLQAARLVESEGIVATLSESLQMTKDGHFRIRSNGEYSQLNTSTVMYRRSAIDRVGYYDSVSLGADLEFLARLRLVYGESAVAIIKQLTMLCCPRESTQATEAEQGRSAAGKSGLHLAYKACFGRWHRAVKEHAYVPFPHVPRRFPAPRQIIVEVAP